ncbi:MAG: hypothetical protein DRJ98_02625 [Thermoprotei archaeon]|nr:MAG: hypothetical protein DRJ98_02625 [Thermoprotei archaeon]RLF14318.1 MAG: hypothetical protein DRN06_07260 [Thermoprotei archaeon]
MKALKFKPIASALGVTLSHPYEGYVSFTSSPYTPHVAWSAVDLSTSTKFGDEALSPVEGKVERIVKASSGAGPYERLDYMISIKPRRSEKVRVKVMHVKPAVKAGDHVVEEDLLGRYIRTNYFSYHHVPHLHVEVCRDTSLRPTRAAPLTPLLPLSEKPSLKKLKVVVDKVEESFALCSLENGGLGITCTIGASRRRALLNGQLGVRAEYLGLLGLRDVEINDPVKVAGSEVAYVKSQLGDRAIAITSRSLSFKSWLRKLQRAYLSRNEAPKPRVKVTSTEAQVRGVELLLSKRWQVKLIPYQGRSWGEELRGKRLELSLSLRRSRTRLS